jgi:aminoglycoside 6-adenylyltransferase
LSTVDWLHCIGTYHLTFLEPTPVENFTERRVLFDGGLDVDFIPLPLEAIRNGLPPEAAGVFRRGFKIILDKDGFVQSLPHVSFEPVRVQPPNQTEYLQLVNDFLYHTVWTAKKLRRGELWAAKLCCDGDMKWKLLKMIEWHSQLVGRQSLDTWHNGRFLDKWADPRVLEQLKHAFAHYDPYDVWQALLATKELFRWLAVEVAQQLDYTYPEAADLYVTNLLKTYQNTP